jgi:hypothetical protein
MRTPIGSRIRKAVDARMAWTLILLSYSDKGTAMVSAAWAGRDGEAQPWGVGKKRGRGDEQGRKKVGETLMGTRIYVTVCRFRASLISV